MRRLVLAGGEMAIADDVPVGVEQFALRISLGVQIARGGGVLVRLQIQQHAGVGQRGLVGGRIVGIGRQEALEHRPGAAEQLDAVELLGPVRPPRRRNGSTLPLPHGSSAGRAGRRQRGALAQTCCASE